MQEVKGILYCTSTLTFLLLHYETKHFNSIFPSFYRNTNPGILSLDLLTDIWTVRNDLMSALPTFVVPRMKAVIHYLTERDQNKILLFGGYNMNFKAHTQVS